MPVLLNIRDVEKEAVMLEDELPVEEAQLESRDELIRFAAPVDFCLSVEKVEQALLVQGVVSVVVECDCARCLQSFSRPIRLDNWTVHLPLTGEGAVPMDGDCVDLTPFLREDILLALPQHPLCSNDCKGLLREGDREAVSPPGPGGDQDKPSPWAELDKLDL